MGGPSAGLGGKSEGEPVFAKRIGILGFGMAMFLLAIVVRLINIQVVDVKTWREKAKGQYESIVTEKACRGKIVDRHGRPLAESIETISFYADPVLMKQPRETAAVFAARFGRGEQYYMRLFRQKKRFVWIERNVPVSKAGELLAMTLPGVSSLREQQRYYLNVASQVIGFTDRDDKGISGLERQLDKTLRGRDGKRIFQRSATGVRYPAQDAEQIDPIRGSDIELTIDADIQGIVEDELLKAVENFNAKAAAGIIMDVRTGEIIAMANCPVFDMNHRVSVSSEQTRNRAVTDMFEPGSTFKIVMAAAATEALHWSAEEMVDGHNGQLTIGNRHINDHEPYGRITFREAIMFSSNIVAATTAMKAGQETFYRYAHDFGFGRKTGIGLIGESSGRLKEIPAWDGTTLPWMGYGYQVMATPLQVLQAYATIANDGIRMKPFVIRRVVDSDGHTVMEYAPQKITQVVRPETARYLAREYFKAVVEKGTGKAASVDGVEVAGKTGTAQKYTGSYQGNRSYLSTFVGFFPVTDPRYAAIVIVDEPKTAYYAAAVAAPVFSKICGRAISCSKQIQQGMARQSGEKQLLDSIKTIAVPHLVGLTGIEAERLLKWNGLVIECTGNKEGVIVRQDLLPGTKVEKERKVRVTLSTR